MPDPLPSDVVARLRSDSTAALAASLILAGSFPDIVSWALRAFSSKSDEPNVNVPARGDGKNRHAPRPQPAVKSDQALLAVMRANPGASLADLIQLGRRPRTSTVLSLKRLEEAGLVEHPSKGVYTAVDQGPLPKSAWVEPLSGSHVARHAADGRGPRRDDDGVRKARNGSGNPFRDGPPAARGRRPTDRPFVDKIGRPGSEKCARHSRQDQACSALRTCVGRRAADLVHGLRAGA
jgi:hypothetical protein